MSELVVFKANELAVSRYDLTEHETKLILCCVALLNPTKENPTREDRTVTFTYQQYAQMMGLSLDNAYHRLNKATSELMTRTVEIIYPTGDIEKLYFNGLISLDLEKINHWNLFLVRIFYRIYSS
ncbi:replication initiation protein [Providencia rustigianii]|uniref:replication initiation protein n=1 Tax=Providencia rustigianii TaxID=158850 RepID=UPI0035E4ED98